MENFWAITVIIVGVISGNEGFMECTTNWKVLECTKSCGGGIQALFGTRKCNMQPCISMMSTMKEPCTAGLDIGIILDKSASVGEKNLEIVINSLENLVNQFNPSPEGDHFGLITFNNESTLVFDFKDQQYQERLALLDKLQSEIGNLGENTHTDLALKMARDKLFTAAGGDRKEKRDVLIILTDGEPYWGGSIAEGTKKPSYEEFKEFAKKINNQFKDKNISIVVVGFGAKAQDMKDVLHLIAGPSGEVFMVKEFNNLKKELLKIKDTVCPVKQ